MLELLTLTEIIFHTNIHNLESRAGIRFLIIVIRNQIWFSLGKDPWKESEYEIDTEIVSSAGFLIHIAQMLMHNIRDK